MIDPTQPPGAVTLAASNLGQKPRSIAFDGSRLWTANIDSVSIITPQATTPYPVTTLSTGFGFPAGVLYDGANIWVTNSNGTLLKLDSSGNILQIVAVGDVPAVPAFDGANIWVPNSGSNTITVVQASTGNVVATITDDATINVNVPMVASFDGERILVTNQLGNTVTVFKAADLSFIANVPTAPADFPYGACSDGINFWVTTNMGHLLRF